MQKIINWFLGLFAWLLLVTLDKLVGAWDYVTMRNNEDTRFD